MTIRSLPAHDPAAGRFDDQIARADKLIQRQIRRRIRECREELPRAFLGSAGHAGNTHRQLTAFNCLHQRLADSAAADDADGFLHAASLFDGLS